MSKHQTLLLVGMLAILPLQTAVAAYQVGDTVADFTLPDAFGNPVSFSDYEGMVVLINFWASW
jgi:cytochrome oxidase Cu insertion factor (SCO1/SenC/PrrC family)